MSIPKKLLLLTALAMASALAQSDSDLKEAKRHYKVALEALADNNVAIASEELNKAVALAPSDALGHYYLARVLSQQNAPTPALEHLARAMSLGLPKKESDLAEDLLAKLQYQAKKVEMDASRPTPEKLVGLYTGEGNEDNFTDWKKEGSYETQEEWDALRRTLSLNIVDKSRITGFIKVDVEHTHARRLHPHGFVESLLTEYKPTKETDREARYFFVDLSVSSDGAIEGTQRQVCWQKPSPYGGNPCELTPSTSASVKVTWSTDGTLTFLIGEAIREYKKTGSTAGSVGADAAYSASELRPFL